MARWQDLSEEQRELAAGLLDPIASELDSIGLDTDTDQAVLAAAIAVEMAAAGQENASDVWAKMIEEETGEAVEDEDNPWIDTEDESSGED